MGDFFAKLKKKIFGRPKDIEQIDRHDDMVGKTDEIVPTPEPIRQEPSESFPQPEREPYFIQIGFDFGTAFCKCVCRDMFLDKAWIHFFPGSEDSEIPFLIPSSLCFDGENLQLIRNGQRAYESGGLYHLKMALQKISLEEWRDNMLEPFRTAAPGDSDEDVARFVELCAVYLIAGAIGNVKHEIAKHYPGKVEDDHLAINMAVPVADANHPRVRERFEKVLRLSWVSAEDLAGHPSTSYAEMVSLIETKGSRKAHSRAILRYMTGFVSPAP